MPDDQGPLKDAHQPLGQATFKSFQESTPEDWQKIGAANELFKQGHASRILTHLKLLEGDCGGFPVSRLEHSLQTATMAHRAGKDEEYVVCALLHDIGDTLGVHNHPDIAAAILKPFVSEANGHPHFEYCAQFCHLFDQPAFDAGYDSMPLSAFEPMVARVMERPKQSIYLRADSTPGW
jgi:hypothetical protein